MNTSPLPSGISIDEFQTLWTQSYLSEYVPMSVAHGMYNAWNTTTQFISDYILLIILAIILIGVLNYFYKILSRRMANIRKLWHFLLFFLTKRQMMIPLLHTLGKREDAISKDLIQKLFPLREQARTLPLRGKMEERLALEQRLSLLLSEYFTVLEQQGKLQKNSRFTQLVQDLDFIDTKLTELQIIYNREATSWNGLLKKLPFLRIRFKDFPTLITP